MNRRRLQVNTEDIIQQASNATSAYKPRIKASVDNHGDMQILNEEDEYSEYGSANLSPQLKRNITENSDRDTPKSPQ